MSAGARSLDRRRAGVVLHPTSLPHPEDQGDLGHGAYRFVDFLAEAGFTVWQTLPLGPTHSDGSPYQCLSVHAGNPRMVSLDWLRDRGWLAQEETAQRPADRAGLIQRAHDRFRSTADPEARDRLAAFSEQQGAWLDDFALYQALRDAHNGRAWYDWPEPLRHREHAALQDARERLSGPMELIRFTQWLFFEQWDDLRSYAAERGVLMFGDMPIFVAHDSAEVWARREYFTVDDDGKAEVVAGVPPDYFSKTGQRWGNPLYRWDRMQADGFAWWLERMRTQLRLFDLIRIDHFRGFEAYWEIPATARTAVDGHWVEAPGHALLSALRDAFHALPLVAEDLGTITPQVEALRRDFGIPGMKVLQFAFGGDAENPYLPHNHEPDYVVYTGTHDNDTTLGWYESLDAHTRGHLLDYLGQPGEPMPRPLLRAALASPALYCLIPMQDLLGLGHGHRMNRPGTTAGNWSWRYRPEHLDPELPGRLRHLLELYGRV